MTTLTERLNELEALRFAPKGSVDMYARYNDSLILAQELHALLVECGEVLESTHRSVSYEISDAPLIHKGSIKARLDVPLTKLQQAGIV